MSDKYFNEIIRRINNLIQIGTVCEIDSKSALVKLKLGPERVSPWVPWIMPRAGEDYCYSEPDMFEQGLLICPEGHANIGVALFGIFSAHHPVKGGGDHSINCQTMKDGTKIEHEDDKRIQIETPDGGKFKYDYKSGKLEIDAKGEVSVKAGKKITLDGKTIELSGGMFGLGGVVTQMCNCSLTGAPHPIASLTVKATK